MEQAPIEEPAAGFAAPADQCVAAWFKGHHRQGSAEVAELGNVFAIQSSLPVLATVAQTGLSPMRRVAGALFIPFHEDLQRFLPLADQAITYPAAETAPIGHQVQGLKNAGLAGAIVSGQQVQARLRREVHRIEATQLVQGEAADLHGARRTIRTGR